MLKFCFNEGYEELIFTLVKKKNIYNNWNKAS